MDSQQTDETTSGVTSVLNGSLTASGRKWLSNKGLISSDVATRAGVKSDNVNIHFPYLTMNGDRIACYKTRDMHNGTQWWRGTKYNKLPFIAHEAPESKGIIVCEGETDALSVASYLGALKKDHTVIGIPGASSFKSEWAEILAGYDDVFVIPDNDEAGDMMMQKIKSLCPWAMRCKLPNTVNDAAQAIMSLGFITKDLIDRAEAVEFKQQPKPVIARRTSKSVEIPFFKFLQEVGKDTNLKQVGKEWKGKCPFHDDSTPSFFLNADKGIYYCHGCEAKGDAVTYMMEKRGMTFKETVYFYG